MAQAVVKKTVVKEVVESITLSLNAEEAKTLRDVMALIGGSPDTSRRKHTDAITEALQGVGFDAAEGGDSEGNIWFTTRSDL